LIREQTAGILAENQNDLAAAPGFGLNTAAIDRLKLTPARLNSAAGALEEIAALPDPVGETIEGSVRPNGLSVARVRVPLGVVFFIYESRPNVTVDAAGICVKSGNAVILRGGKEAWHSNQALYGVLREALQQTDLPAESVQLVETTDRAAVGQFLKLRGHIDVTIPRGGKSLIERVVAEATMPVDGGDCEQMLARFAGAGIDVHALAAQLQDEGAKAFVNSWNDLMNVISSKSDVLKQAG